ncbi:MAG: Rpn family recombination-promoting nuclease/putative transposase [Xenococcaceae cyanobacterium]
MYDNTCKFIAETFTTDIATWLLGEPLTLTKLEPSELSLEPIRADSLIMLQSDEMVLHIEFQTDPDSEIPFRMADYRLRVFRRYPRKQMRQVVVYLRKTSSQLVRQTVFEISGLRHSFEVIRLWEQPAEAFFGSSGLLPFAVLSQTDDRAEVLREVARRTEALANRREQSNVMASAALLAGLVLEKELIYRVLRRDIMRESVIYKEIKAEGEAKKAREVALKMLNAGMELEQVAQMTGLTVEQVKQLQQRN